MTIYRVLKYPHVLLRKKSTEVVNFSSDLAEFIENMVKTMYAFEGIGLAAPQVGVLKNIIVVDVSPFLNNESLKEWEGQTICKIDGTVTPLEFPLKLINPRIVDHGPACSFPFDGCLSLPGLPRGTTERFSHIILEAKTSEGKTVNIETSGILSICLQHEMDHLNGVLFIDRLGKTIEGKRIIAEIEDYENDASERKRIKKLKPQDAQSIKFNFL